MKKILIVVDIQNGFIRYDQTKKVANKIIDLVNSKVFDTVVATRFKNKEGSQYTKFLNWHRLIDSPDIDLVNGLHPDVVYDKWIYTCINDEFISILKSLNDGELPTHIFICGADTDCCVLKIAADLFEYGIMPLVLSAYCDSNGGPDSHDAGLLVMKRVVGRNSIIADEQISNESLEKMLSDRKYQ